MKKRVLAYFKKHPTAGIKAKLLSRKLHIASDHEYQQLKSVLHQLVDEGFLLKKGKRFVMSPQNTQNLIGTLFVSESGNYGFVTLQNSQLKDIFIPAKYMGTAFQGDTVEVALLAKKRGKNLEGQIKKIVKRKRNEIAGTLRKTKSFYFVEPDEPALHRDFYIANENLNEACDGDKVIVGDIEWESAHLNPEGKIVQVLGRAGSYESEIAALGLEFNLPTSFPQEVIEETEKISENIPAGEIKKRLDLRSTNVFTIDPKDAKDFDDAVSIEIMDNGNYSVGIHIADVSHYISTRSALYKDALSRGTSVYFVGRVIPMLPERLSNKICSLVPNQDRLTYSVIAEITPRGKIVQYQIKKTVINSKKRFTYEEAQETLDTKDGKFYKELSLLNRLAKTLKSKRIRNGSINFHSSEVEFTLNEDGKPIEINPKILQETNNLIEEFMLLANQIVCRHIDEHRGKSNFPFVYRVHDVPDEEKIKEFSTFVKTLGYTFNPRSAEKAKQFQELLGRVEGTAEEAVINEVAIRSMSKAIYSDQNIGHYGLAFKHYTHFTSPIRRFPDLIVHKLLFNFLEHDRKVEFSEKQIDHICKHSSGQERNAMEAERLSVKLKQIEYLSGKLGEEFPGVISGVTNFGIFVKIDDILAEGLIRLGDMEDDFYVYDEKNFRLKGKSTGKVYKLGDKINVKLIRVDEEKRLIDFFIVDEAS